MSAATSRRAADFAALARQLADERTTAGERLTELLRSTPRENWPRLAEDPALHNNATLERLSKEVHTAIDRQPQEALDLSALGVAIAEALRDGQYPPVVLAQIRAHAWKDRAQALAFNGHYDSALESINRADAILTNFGTAAHDRAIVRLVKATVFQYLRRFDDALPLLEEAREIFDAHADQKWLMQCGINEGIILYRKREFDAAREVFTELLRLGPEDSYTAAAIHNNLANCLIEIGNIAEANVHVSEATAHFNSVGNRTDALRTELAAGRLLSTKGRTTDALIRLRSTRKKFADFGLIEEAAICGLDIAAALLAEHRDAEARQMFESVRSDISTVNDRALAAVSYLATHFAAHDATPAVVRHVTEYLEALRSDPTREFVTLA
jgi:tetratricopeptide (TPR) repeat protein